MDGQPGCPTTPTERRVPGMSNSRSAAICATHFIMDVHPSGLMPVAGQLDVRPRCMQLGWGGQTTYHATPVAAALPSTSSACSAPLHRRFQASCLYGHAKPCHCGQFTACTDVRTAQIQVLQVGECCEMRDNGCHVRGGKLVVYDMPSKTSHAHDQAQAQPQPHTSTATHVNSHTQPHTGKHVGTWHGQCRTRWTGEGLP